MSAPILLSVAGVTKSFGPQRVLDGIDLEVPTGAIAAVLGPSGCGKTTLLRLIAGFDELDSGTISIAGQVVAAGPPTAAGSRRSRPTSLPPERRGVGVVPQEGALFPHLDLEGNVGYGLANRGKGTDRVREMLALVGLGGMERKRPHELSGGQQQRVALARALAPGPALILLDEPFSSLDAAMRAQVRDEVFEVLRAAGATAVLVTHDQQEALSVADQVAVLLGGRVAQCGEPTDLYVAPASRAVATFVGEAVVLPGVASGATALCALGELSLTAGAPTFGEVELVIRPEQFAIGDVEGPGTAGVVIGRSYYGHDGVARVQLGTGEVVVCRTPAGWLPTRGDAVRVQVATPVIAFAAAG